jgi:hypothetical protein
VAQGRRRRNHDGRGSAAAADAPPRAWILISLLRGARIGRFRTPAESRA